MRRKRKIDDILGEIEIQFNNDLIYEICCLYAQLVIDDELTETTRDNLLNEYPEFFNDHDNAGHYSWIALAYLQSEIGLQDDLFKKNALSIIRLELEKKEVRSGISKQYLLKLKSKICSSPRSGIISEKPQYFNSTWKIGDVFALRLDNKEYIDFNLHGRYILIVNVGTHICFPKHICPKILCYNWHGEKSEFDLKRISELDFLPIFFINENPIYKILVCIEDEVSLNNSNLIYIGNISNLSIPDNIIKDIID